MREWLATFFSHPVVLLALVAGIVRGIYWVASINSDRSRFHEFISEVRDDIKTIRKDIREIFRRTGGTAPIASSSPVKLTEYGENIAKALGAPAWAGQIAPGLKDRVAGKQPYQIEEFARDYVKAELSDEWVEKVNQEAFRRGSRRDDIGSVL